MKIRCELRKLCFMLLACVLLAAAGCGQAKRVQADINKINVAIVCRDGMQYDALRFQKGMEMAIAEYAGERDIAVTLYDHPVNFEEALELDTRLAQDPDMTAVVTLQDYDEINVAARLMNENNKAFFAVEGYHDVTAGMGYETFFPFCLNAAHLGNAMGIYAGEQGLRRPVVIHSGTPFERTQANYFERALLAYGAYTINSISEPTTSQEILAFIDALDTLDASAVYLPYYRSYWAMDILSNIKDRYAGIQILASFTLGSMETVEMLEEAEGAILPAFYPLERNGVYAEWEERYRALYGEIPENQAAQGYDIMNLVIKNYDGDNARVARNIRDRSLEATGLAGQMIYEYINGLQDISYETDESYHYEHLIIRNEKLVPVDF